MYVITQSLKFFSWSLVLHRMHENDFKLLGAKTVICPRKTTILGWVLNSGMLSVSQHKVSHPCTAAPPKTCTSMGSYIGAYKAMSHCIPRYASLLSPLEDSTKGLQGSQQIVWSSELLTYFKRCQEALKSRRTLIIPTPSDKLVMSVDASPVNQDISAILFVI